MGTLRTVYFYKDDCSSAIVAWIKIKTQTAVILSTLCTFAFLIKLTFIFKSAQQKIFFFILLTSEYFHLDSKLFILKQDDFSLADIFQIEVSSVDLFYIFIYLCDFAKSCPLSFRVLLDVSREPSPEPIRG